jgi:hypothetical protein
MPPAISDLDNNIRKAFRQAWGTVEKATTGAVNTIRATPDGYVRSVGSFLADRFDVGDEITVSGFPRQPTSNGMGWIEYVDDLTMHVRRPVGTTMVAEAAGALVTIRAGMPAVQLTEGWISSTEIGRPWMRETYQPNLMRPASLRAPTAKVRYTGVMWLNLFYPIDTGENGVERLRGKIIQQIYPASTLVYAGQVIRVQTATPKGLASDRGYTNAPVSWTFQTDTINPA